MSHLKERSEKICLNCNAELQGRYCHACGQENIEPRESAWHLLTHFFKDITHFDGKFFSTLRYLVMRPGFLSKEYIAGKRNRYLNPVRMYVFTSAIFFLIFFSFSKISDKDVFETSINGKQMKEIEKMDSAQFADFTRQINREDHKPDVPMTRSELQHYKDSVYKKSGVSVTGKNYSSKAEYDAYLQSGKEKHNWLKRQLTYKQIAVNEKYGNDTRAIFRAYIDKLMHSLPQMLFISLPLFALILKLLYIRRKSFYYVDHVIFTIHLYIFNFILLLVIYGISKLNARLDWDALTILNVLMFLGLVFYEYKAMRKFYLQKRGKTVAKFFLLNIVFFFFLMLLFSVFLVFSFFNI